MKYSKTSSGGAAMCTDAVYGSTAMLGLDRGLEAREATGPELREEGLERLATQPEGGLMAQLRKTISIDAPADAVWGMLGDLAATPEWLPGTVSARMDESIRICTTADGNTIREEISDYSPERRTYTYRHLEIPLSVRDSIGTFTVEAEGVGAVVVLDAAFEALDPEMEPKIERMFGDALEQALESLRRRLERGLTWQAA